MPDHSLEAKKDLMRKYALGLAEIWKGLIAQGPENGDPIPLFEEAIRQTEASLASLLAKR